MSLLDQYLLHIQEEETEEQVSVSAGIGGFESPHTGKKLKLKEQALQSENVIAVDFDGTIHQASRGFLNGEIYDPPTEGCREALSFLKNLGFTIAIYTTRLSREANPDFYKTSEKIIREWLDKQKIPFDRIVGDKIFALCYIDDKAIRFGNWTDVLKMLKLLKII